MCSFNEWVVTGRSARGRWQRVVDARRQAREALGRTADHGPFDAPTPKRSAVDLHAPSIPAAKPDRPVLVLTIGEAATRLGLTRRELEAMIERGEVATLKGEFIRVIPATEVERLAPG